MIQSLREQRVAAIALVSVLAGVLAFAVARPDVRPSGLMRDFNAFYCAGRALSQQSDPYRTEPLGACERERKPAPLLTGPPGLAMPAPLPPYALALFVALSKLPYVWAAALWSLCLVGSLVITVWAVRRTTGLALAPLIAAFALTDGYAALCLGQIAPLAVAGIALATMYAREGRAEAAALSAAFAMLEPHVGLPACVALFVWNSRSRAVLLLLTLGAAGLSVALAGIPITLEYLRDVIPAHALSEVSNEKQFSLTYLLHRFGAADAIAVHAGECWYAAMVCAGLFLARAVATRTRDVGAIVAIPPIVTLLGGPFVHVVQMPAALPGAFFLYAHSSGAMRRAAGVAICALAIPWVQFLNLGMLFLILAAFVTAFCVATLVDGRPIAVVASAVAAVAFLSFLMLHGAAVPGNATATLLAHLNPRALAESSWTIYVSAIGNADVRAFDIARIPTLLGLATLVCSALAAGLRPMKTSRRPTHFALAGEDGGRSRRTAFR